MARNRNNGLCMIEVLMGLAISSLVFTAIALAVSAGSQATTINQDFASATQVGRVGLSYMLTTIRTSARQAPEAGEALDTQDFTVKFELYEGRQVDAYFRFYRDGENVLLHKWITPHNEPLTIVEEFPTPPEPDPAVARHVTSFLCRRQLTGGIFTNYQVDMTVGVGKQLISFSESVVPRRAMALR